MFTNLAIVSFGGPTLSNISPSSIIGQLYPLEHVSYMFDGFINDTEILFELSSAKHHCDTTYVIIINHLG